MRGLAVLRALGPPGWSVAVALALVAVMALGRGLGLRWDPFDLAGRRLAAAEARAVAAGADADARRLEVEGAAEQTRRLVLHHQQDVLVARATDHAVTHARTADDASNPLDPDRLARLRDHDRRLCQLAPAVCAAAPVDAADGGDGALSAGPASGGGERG